MKYPFSAGPGARSPFPAIDSARHQRAHVRQILARGPRPRGPVLSRQADAPSVAEEDRALPPEIKAAKALEVAMRGERIPLPHQASMEARFGRSFDGVRSFAGPQARAACESVGARAFAVRDVVALAERAPPEHVVAHEVVHVLQQDGLASPLRGAPSSLPMGAPGDRHEREAERVVASAPPVETNRAQPGASDQASIGVHGKTRLDGFFWLSGCSNTEKEQATRQAGTSTPPAKKTVTVNITHMEGSSGDPTAAIAHANTKIYSQANVELQKGTEVTVKDTPSKAVLGNDLILDEYASPATPTTEEKALFKLNQPGSGVTMYFVKGMSDGSTGESFWPALGHGFVGFVNNASANATTFSHELGHVLLDSGGHNVPDDTYLMYGSKSSTKWKLSAAEVASIRSSPYVK